MSNKTIKQKKVINEDMTYIKNMFIILGIVVLVSVGLDDLGSIYVSGVMAAGSSDNECGL